MQVTICEPILIHSPIIYHGPVLVEQQVHRVYFTSNMKIFIEKQNVLEDKIFLGELAKKTEMEIFYIHFNGVCRKLNL